mmetsp:Transcript_90994/g.254181  ORF Transcript_90994/g.254181 Transcript_90994/m.254181 type:complete len:255 (+) Transcript_90994:315-1079(+)
MEKDNFWKAFSSSSIRCIITLAPNRGGGSRPKASPRPATIGMGGASTPAFVAGTRGNVEVMLGRRHSPLLLPVRFAGLTPPSATAATTIAAPLSRCSPLLAGRKLGALNDFCRFEGKAIFKRKASAAGLCNTCRSCSAARAIIGGETHVVVRYLSDNSLGNGSSRILRSSFSCRSFFALASRSRFVRWSSLARFSFATARPLRHKRFDRAAPGDPGDAGDSGSSPSPSQARPRSGEVHVGLKPGDAGSDGTGLS